MAETYRRRRRRRRAVPAVPLLLGAVLVCLTAAVLCGPAATPGAAAFAALPSAVLLPFMFVRIHRGIALLLYLLLLASAVAEAVLRYSI